jgi:hypothetical protein
MRVTSKIILDLQRITTLRVDVMQNDANTREVQVSLYDDGVAWEPPAGIIVSLACRKPDGNYVWYDKLPDGSTACTINGNSATIVLAPEVTTAPGRVEAAVVFQTAELDQLATFPFHIYVARNPAASTVLSQSYYNYSTIDGLNGAINSLDRRIDSVVNDLNAGIEAILSRLAQEAATRAANDDYLETKIDNEAALRENGDANLNARIDQEAAARAAEDTRLRELVDQEAAARSAEEARLEEDYLGRDAEIWEKVNQMEAAHTSDIETLGGNIALCEQHLGDLSALDTEEKDNTVAAINEVLGVAHQKEVFIADYNNTTLAEILSARDSGKVCVCSYNDYLLLLNGATNSEATFTAWYGIGTYLKCSVDADNHWSVERKNYYKTPTITANNTDDQIPTAAAVYKAMVNAGSEPEIYIGYEDESTWDNLSRQIGYGKLVFVQENKVTKRLHQYYGHSGTDSTMRFYRVDGDGIHWLAVDRENVWSSGTTEITGGGSQETDVVTVQLTSNPTSGYTADKTYAQMLEAYKAGKMIVLMQGRLLHVPMSYGPNGMVFYPLPTAYNAPNSNKKYTVTSEDVWSYENANLPVPYTKTVNASSTDNYLPTAKAVYDAIEAKFAAFTNVAEVGA